MANRERGEMTLAARNTTYTLRLTTNACCELEDRLAKAGETVQEPRLVQPNPKAKPIVVPMVRPRHVDDVVAGAKGGSVRDLRWLLWAALQDQHGAVLPNPEDVGTLIDDAGGVAGVLTQMLAFMALNAPPADPEGAAKGDTPADPLTAEIGGARSTSAPAGSA